MNLYAAALLTGLLGSLHCAAMCGPLALTACASRKDALFYFAGRVVSYATVGAILGHVGRHALCVLPVGWVQNIAVLVVAAFVAVRGLRLLLPAKSAAADRLAPLRPRAGRPGAPRTAASSQFGALLASLLPRRGLGLGLATGILPCGMLVPAWLLAASSEHATTGAGLMALYALATLPGLLLPLAVRLFGRPLLGRLRARLTPRAQGLAWLALAVFIAARPLLNAAHHHGG